MSSGTDLLYFIHQQEMVECKDYRSFWTNKTVTLENIRNTLLNNMNISLPVHHELIMTTTNCLGGPTEGTLTACQLLCYLLESLPEELNDSILFFVARKVLHCLDTHNEQEKEGLTCVLHVLYTKNISERTSLRTLFGETMIKSLKSDSFHKGTKHILKVLDLIIQGFALPMKQQHLEYCREFLIPLLRSEGLDTFYESLCSCLHRYALAAPGIAHEICSATLQSCSKSSSLTIGYLFEFSVALLLLTSESEFYSLQVLLYGRIKHFLKDAKYDLALSAFEHEILCVRMAANSMISSRFLLAAFQTAIVACTEQYTTSRCNMVVRLLSGF